MSFHPPRKEKINPHLSSAVTQQTNLRPYCSLHTQKQTALVVNTLSVPDDPSSVVLRLEVRVREAEEHLLQLMPLQEVRQELRKMASFRFRCRFKRLAEQRDVESEAPADSFMSFLLIPIDMCSSVPLLGFDSSPWRSTYIHTWGVCCALHFGLSRRFRSQRPKHIT